MTARLFSRILRHTSVQVAVALLAGLSLATTALTSDLKAPSAKSKLLRDKDVTVIIIDKHHDRSKSKHRKSGASASSSLRQPSSRIKRGDDVEIRIKRTDGGTIVRSGAKVIIVDKTTRGCKGDGVCIIRP